MTRAIHGLAGITVVVALAVVGCEAGGTNVSGSASESVAEPQASTDEHGENDEPEHHYSAFGVKMQTPNFEMMSFKDVGLGRTNPSTSGRLLEAIAQSIAFEFHRSDKVTTQAKVVHDERLADPDEHTYCESGRVYVDLWRSSNPDRWGYSMWSGCSKTQKFASDELEVATAPEAGPLHRAVEPLAKAIVQSFVEAAGEDCFRRSC